TLSGHTSPVTTIADSSTPSRFIYPSLTRTSRGSEAYLRWRSAPLSTMYPSTTSVSSTGDLSSKSSVEPSRKRSRSPSATVPLPIPAPGALVPTHVVFYHLARGLEILIHWGIVLQRISMQIGAYRSVNGFVCIATSVVFVVS
ncbi:hypothetical protein Tco_0326001, partial [Tanacetum coccineum]